MNTLTPGDLLLPETWIDIDWSNPASNEPSPKNRETYFRLAAVHRFSDFIDGNYVEDELRYMHIFSGTDGSVELAAASDVVEDNGIIVGQYGRVILEAAHPDYLKEAEDVKLFEQWHLKVSGIDREPASWVISAAARFRELYFDGEDNRRLSKTTQLRGNLVRFGTWLTMTRQTGKAVLHISVPTDYFSLRPDLSTNSQLVASAAMDESQEELHG